MLSNPLQRFSPYNNLPSSSSSIGVQNGNHATRTHTRSNGLNSLRQTYQYNLPEPGQHSNIQGRHLSRPIQQPKPRHQPYGPGTKSSASSGGVRRRISRACDQCNQLRTKCDGQHPCAHCVEFGLGCEYARERKKRGKASRKDLAQQAAAQAAADTTIQNGSNDSQDGESDESVQRQQNSNSPSPSIARRSHSISQTENGAARKMSAHEADNCLPQTTADNVHVIGDITGQVQLNGHTTLDQSHINNAQIFDLNTYPAVSPSYDRQGLNGSMMPHEPYGPSQTINNYSDIPYGMQIHSSSSYGNAANFRVGDNSLDGYAMVATTSPGWEIPAASPAGLFQQAQASQASFQRHPNLRYPVLEPLVPHLGNMIPLSLACDLLDLYFSSSSSAQMHPMSPYVLGFVFRKRAFLHPTKPRKCQPALLASMLWVAAQTSEASFLTSLPSARSKVCHKLLNLTISLLKPLIHTPSAPQAAETSPVVGAVSLGSLGVAVPGSISMDTLTGEGGAFGAAGNVDDVATYIHLATVVSASEYKGASIRWWNAAWSLGRELKLGRELPPNEASLAFEPLDGDDDGLDEHDMYRNTTEYITEEEREERRRIWWLIYIVDRHLALCYNRPLFLLDVECDELLRPMDDTTWQRGDFRSNSNTGADDDVLNPAPNGTSTDSGVRGPDFECRGHSIFGYFLPLMTILGEVVDLHHARNHPRFGADFRPHQQWDEWTSEITRHLEVYEHSLKKFERKHLPKKTDDKNDEPSFGENGESHGIMPEMGTPSTHSGHTNTSSRMTESEIQARIVVAYSTHVMHVLHILLTGKWDPISLIDDNDFWISSQGFVTATSHAVAAAEAINQILEYDAGLEFMPFFFGIYLLQGSFLLLLIADKLQFEASSNVVRACETIVRAHEACVVTLSTEYQRNFSKVMRSALAVVRGRVPEDLTEQHQRKRELLGLYRWTGDGTGLAL